MKVRVIAVILLACVFAKFSYAQTSDCAKPPSSPILHIALPGHPFSAIPSADGCAIFVSLTGSGGRSSSRIVVLSRKNGVAFVTHVSAAEGALTGMALSPDGRLLAAANGPGVTLFDTARLLSAADKPAVAYLSDGSRSGAVYVSFSADGKLLFASDEDAHRISVHDMNSILQGKGDRVIGQIPTERGPVGLAISPDGRLLYSTSEVAGDGRGPCGGEGPGGRPAGELMVIDIAKAAVDPRTSTLFSVPAGCSPVRVALSPKGDIAYVTARGDNTLMVFDTAKLASDSGRALMTRVRVGSAPVGVLATDSRIYVTNSDRFGGSQHQSVSVLDANDVTRPATKVPAGGFPRELKVTPDGGTLLVTNFNSDTLELVDVGALAKP